MTDMPDDSTHPITTHLRNAAEHIRLANHASHDNRRELTDLCDTFSVLSTLLYRLHDFIRHLHRIVDRADASFYETYDGRPAAETLDRVGRATDEAFSKINIASNTIRDAVSDIGQLRIHDTGTDLA